MAYDKFLGYLELCLTKLSNENKEVYLCGDFNSDLLKLNGVNNYKRFYELMCSKGIYHRFFSQPEYKVILLP